MIVAPGENTGAARGAVGEMSAVRLQDDQSNDSKEIS